MTKTARLYGDSLYDLAVEEGVSAPVLEQASQIRQIFRENPDYLHLLCEPSLTKSERTGLIDKAFGDSTERYLLNFMKLLCERGLLGEFAGCCEEMERRYCLDNNIATAVVYAAVALDDAQKAALQSKLEKITGKTIRMEVKIDPSVIAGLRVEVDGELLDGTVQGRMSGISRKLEEIV